MPGFDFSNHTRNTALHARGVPLPKATSTGTTIVGCIFDGGVVVGTFSTSVLATYAASLSNTDPHKRRARLRLYFDTIQIANWLH